MYLEYHPLPLSTLLPSRMGAVLLAVHWLRSLFAVTLIDLPAAMSSLDAVPTTDHHSLPSGSYQATIVQSSRFYWGKLHDKFMVKCARFVILRSIGRHRHVPHGLYFSIGGGTFPRLAT